MDLPLSSSEMSILKQGLSFIHTPHTVDEFEIRCDFEKFARRMRLFAHIHENHNKEQSQPCNDISTYNFNDPFERLRPNTSSGTPRKVSIHHLMCSYPNAELISTTFYVTILLLCLVILSVRTKMQSRDCRRKSTVCFLVE